MIALTVGALSAAGITTVPTAAGAVTPVLGSAGDGTATLLASAGGLTSVLAANGSLAGTIADWIAGICLVAGALLSLAAGVGVLRFPEVLDRMHAATKPQVLGVLLLLIGVGLRLRTGADLGMIMLVGIFQLATAPVAAQMIGRAAYRSGRVDTSRLDTDELAGKQPSSGPS